MPTVTSRPDNNVLNIAREGLRIPLRAALHRAVTTHERVEEKQISLQTNGSVTDVDLSVEPLAEFPNNLYIVVLEPIAPTHRERQDKTETRDSNAEATIQYLESELRSCECKSCDLGIIRNFISGKPPVKTSDAPCEALPPTRLTSCRRA